MGVGENYEILREGQYRSRPTNFDYKYFRSNTVRKLVKQKGYAPRGENRSLRVSTSLGQSGHRIRFMSLTGYSITQFVK